MDIYSVIIFLMIKGKKKDFNCMNERHKIGYREWQAIWAENGKGQNV